MSKNVAFYIKSTSDIVNSVDGVTYNLSAAALAQQYASTFWIQAGADSIPDLCTQTTKQSITANLTAPTGQYVLTSQDFIGGRPDIRR
jgi:hypothetical protein